VSLLRLDSVTTYYGEIRILEDVSLEVGEGELVCLLGGNASGKSTTLKTILGLVRPRAGTVEFAGRDVTGEPTSGRIARGMAIVPENRRLFAPLTVEENLELGAYLRDAWRTRARRSSASSRACASGAPSSPERSPAASSRWLRWGGR
jgi:branched-chain amino acid transport system ATP-binding protein